MPNPVPLVEVWRGAFLECVHEGHAVVVDEKGEVVAAWGDPDAVILPRSSAKMIQALPLVESGAADAAALSSEHLALACASHNGAEIHAARVRRWLADLGLCDDDLRCGPQMPADDATFRALIKADAEPEQVHNNCSGKHTGFLTLARHLGGGPEYIEPGHPVQRAVLEAFEDATGEASPGHAIDGCSAPNFATTLKGLARAMARFATASGGADVRSRAMARLCQAMVTHPELVAGEGRACTELMRAAAGRAALKTGAEGVFAAILPDERLGIAVKIADGATRASECAIAALLVRFGVLPADHPAVRRRMLRPVVNRRGIVAGEIRPSTALAPR